MIVAIKGSILNKIEVAPIWTRYSAYFDHIKGTAANPTTDIKHHLSSLEVQPVHEFLKDF